jgi:hypothetical protein
MKTFLTLMLIGRIKALFQSTGRSTDGHSLAGVVRYLPDYRPGGCPAGGLLEGTLADIGVACGHDRDQRPLNLDLVENQLKDRLTNRSGGAPGLGYPSMD